MTFLYLVINSLSKKSYSRRVNSDIFQERLLVFAKNNYDLVRNISSNLYKRDYISQLIRSSSSPGANYIEAIEASSRKDFTHRLKICRKEAKESIYWLKLLMHANNDTKKRIEVLIVEAQELVKILSASIRTIEKSEDK